MLCRYFQQGYCRYGSSCRYVHDEVGSYQSSSKYNNNNYYYEGQNYNNKYRYNRNNDSNNYDNKNNHYEEGPNENDLLFQAMVDDMIVWNNSNIWPISCYGFAKLVKCLPGFEEYSYEEIRYFCMESMKNNQMPSYSTWLNELIQKNVNARNQLLNLSEMQKIQMQKMISEYVMEMERKEEADSNKTFQQTKVSLDAAQTNLATPTTNIFATNDNILQQKKPNIFQQHHQQQQQPLNIFAPQQHHQPQNIFGQLQQHQQQQQQPPNIFAQQQHQPHNIFGQPQQQQHQPQNIFGQQHQQQGIYMQQQQQQPQYQQQPHFQRSTFVPIVGNVKNSYDDLLLRNVFAGNNNTPSANNNAYDIDDSVYSKLDELIEPDAAEFRADNFTYVPLLPPPKMFI
ncbi:hypothetical protein HELRODRAFT_194945 [Helobdella robusta]|uniref:Nucleoporin NUP42 n=1 Tax=Helobdella robusta TaxID=6412 RepID=T1FWL5_HELRO|nr:hypothetical protein HELRODRAFT_194945 [Helobdella robusta]ESO10404.1 hypothetical protein HELRODRAFT_194945 [Helobdella robusta]